MSHSESAHSLHLSDSDLASDPGKPDRKLNHLPNLKKLVPQNLSNNKRAIIERLIALHYAESIS